jgi:hypothetical protein
MMKISSLCNYVNFFGVQLHFEHSVFLSLQAQHFVINSKVFYVVIYLFVVEVHA